jgi:hypothetical protein
MDHRKALPSAWQVFRYLLIFLAFSTSASLIVASTVSGDPDTRVLMAAVGFLGIVVTFLVAQQERRLEELERARDLLKQGLPLE